MVCTGVEFVLWSAGTRQQGTQSCTAALAHCRLMHSQKGISLYKMMYTYISELQHARHVYTVTCSSSKKPELHTCVATHLGVVVAGSRRSSHSSFSRRHFISMASGKFHSGLRFRRTCSRIMQPLRFFLVCLHLRSFWLSCKELCFLFTLFRVLLLRDDSILASVQKIMYICKP